MKNGRLITTVQSIPIKLRIYRLSRTILVWFLFGALVNLLLSYVFYTPKSYYINRENKALADEILAFDNHIKGVGNEVNILQSRYVNIYKALFGLPEKVDYEIDFDVSDQKYSYLRKDRYLLSIKNIYTQTDVLNQDIVSLSYSLDAIATLTKDKDLMLESLPVLLPIHKDDYSHISDRFGPRFHPIYARLISHKGLDIACDVNTPIYAPADGVVVSTIHNAGGFGKLLTIKHGYGYDTRYAHLNAFKAKRGDKVKRGEIIALSGNTGRSTGPHLHYEVMFNGINVNPINYISRNMTTEEFAKIIESSKIDTLKEYGNLKMLDNSNEFIIE